MPTTTREPLTTHSRWERLTCLADRIERRYRLSLNVRPTDAKRLFARLRKVALAADGVAAEEELPSNWYVWFYHW